MTSVRWLSRLPLTALPALPDGGWLVPFSWILGLVLDPLADLDADEVADGCWDSGGATGGLVGVAIGTIRRQELRASGLMGIRRSVAVTGGSDDWYTGLTRGDSGLNGFFLFLQTPTGGSTHKKRQNEWKRSFRSANEASGQRTQVVTNRIELIGILIELLKPWMTFERNEHHSSRVNGETS